MTEAFQNRTEERAASLLNRQLDALNFAAGSRVDAQITLHQLGLPLVILSLSFLPVDTTLLGGPRLSRWLLTSNARLSPGVKNQQMFEEI